MKACSRCQPPDLHLENVIHVLFLLSRRLIQGKNVHHLLLLDIVCLIFK
jgi:hypothetical protein